MGAVFDGGPIQNRKSKRLLGNQCSLTSDTVGNCLYTSYSAFQFG